MHPPKLSPNIESDDLGQDIGTVYQASKPHFAFFCWVWVCLWDTPEKVIFYRIARMWSHFQLSRVVIWLLGRFYTYASPIVTVETCRRENEDYNKISTFQWQVFEILQMQGMWHVCYYYYYFAYLDSISNARFCEIANYWSFHSYYSISLWCWYVLYSSSTWHDPRGLTTLHLSWARGL